jgi:glycosyltransferase involved in cell wall biosynthesis
MWELYASAAVLLHPTRQESFGRVILESLASGTPVVTTSIPSHRSLGLPLEYASSIPEMCAKLEDHYVRWKTDYADYVESARGAVDSVSRFDSRVLLPQYETMLREVLADGVP